MLTVGVVAHNSRPLPQSADIADFISVDDGTLGCTANHLHVLRTLSKRPSTWTVVLEDDAVVTEDFVDQLGRALPMAPTPIVSLYLGKKRPPHWQRRIATALAAAEHADASWIVSTHLLHAVGYAIRTDLLPSLLWHVSSQPIDQHISDWAKLRGHLTAYTYPSLIDHADLPTTFTHPDKEPRRPGRKAWRTGTRTEWSTEAVPLR